MIIRLFLLIAIVCLVIALWCFLEPNHIFTALDVTAWFIGGVLAFLLEVALGWTIGTGGFARRPLFQSHAAPPQQ